MPASNKSEELTLALVLVCLYFLCAQLYGPTINNGDNWRVSISMFFSAEAGQPLQASYVMTGLETFQLPMSAMGILGLVLALVQKAIGLDTFQSASVCWTLNAVFFRPV